MCTLTYLPLSDNTYLLTSNRDESPLRKKAKAPEITKINGAKVLYPMDGRAGGTWIAASEANRIACLLNGAFERHWPNPPYRLSRGLMVLDSFRYHKVDEFISHYDFKGMEPFTFVAFEHLHQTVINELRWDGQQSYVKRYDATKPQIWSSASLYTPEVVKRREQWFQKWLKEHTEYDVNEIRQFHMFGGEGDIYNDIRMNRLELVKTISITSVKVETGKIEMWYKDLLNDQLTYKFLPIRSSDLAQKN